MSATGLEAVAVEVAACQACRLAGTRQLTVPGDGDPDARVVLLGEAPGAEEDRTGLPFVGRSGRLLDELLGQAGSSRDEVFITSMAKCRPPGNRNPRADELAACRPHLDAQLSALDSARVVVTLGNVPTQAMLSTTVGITKLRGTARQVEGLSPQILPTFHPAAALRGGSSVAAVLAGDLRAALDLGRRGS